MGWWSVLLRYVEELNADKSKMRVLGREMGLKYEICMDEAQLKEVSKFKYLG